MGANGAKLLEAKGKALDTLITLLDHREPGIRLRAAAALVRIDTPCPAGETDPEKVAKDQAFANMFSF